eukprot:TRINITY_DN250_c0_g1_i2.p1 TRINITY_DN250_c0_g1~~TRINITY_DN250_c0_g1_i2.p1  ORF type:complete len:224 (-),score=37.57 TRINITY_DN250_c0_g1_i2:377-1006(-)
MKFILTVLAFIAPIQIGAQLKSVFFSTAQNMPQTVSVEDDGPTSVFEGVLPAELAPGEETVEDAFLLGLEGLEDVSTFVELLSIASKVEPIDTTNPYTIFVPNNKGFDEYFSERGRDYEDLTQNRQTLLGLILRYHIVQGVALRTEDLEDGQTLDTLGNQSLQVRKEEEKVTIVGIRTEGEVVQANITIGETVVHIVDAVLLPNVIFKR